MTDPGGEAPSGSGPAAVARRLLVLLVDLDLAVLLLADHGGVERVDQIRAVVQILDRLVVGLGGVHVE